MNTKFVDTPEASGVIVEDLAKHFADAMIANAQLAKTQATVTGLLLEQTEYIARMQRETIESQHKIKEKIHELMGMVLAIFLFAVIIAAIVS